MARARSRPLPSESRRFGSLRVLRDGRVRFSAWTVPGLPHLSFTAQYMSLDVDDTPVYDMADYSICAELRGQPIFFLHLAHRRVESAGFAYNLAPDTLREAIAVLRAVGNGLEQWIVPALERDQGSASIRKNNPEIYNLIPELLESLSALPVAAQWEKERRRIQRYWEKLVVEHPEEAANAPAPWVLANARRSAASPGRKPAKAMTQKKGRDKSRRR